MLAPWKKSYDQPRQHIKKQRHYYANKGPSSQSCGFSSSHVWMWELDYKGSWARCKQVYFLLRSPCWLAGGHLLTAPSHGLPSLCVHSWYLSKCPLIKTPVRWPTLNTSFQLIHLFKDYLQIQSPSVVSEVVVSECEFWRTQFSL